MILNSSQEKDVTHFEEHPTKFIKKERNIIELTVRDDGTALDSITGLTWCRHLFGQDWHGRRALGLPKMITLTQAQQHVHDINRVQFATFKDWRLPTSEELKEITGEHKIIKAKEDSLLGIHRVIFSEVSESNGNPIWTAFHHHDVDAIASLAAYYGGQKARNGLNLKYVRLVRGNHKL
jgi:hypothetical protein